MKDNDSEVSLLLGNLENEILAGLSNSSIRKFPCAKRLSGQFNYQLRPDGPLTLEIKPAGCVETICFAVTSVPRSLATSPVAAQIYFLCRGTRSRCKKIAGSHVKTPPKRPAGTSPRDKVAVLYISVVKR